MFDEWKSALKQRIVNQHKMDELRAFDAEVQKRANTLQMKYNHLEADYTRLLNNYRRLEYDNKSLRMDNDLVHRYCASAYEELARRAVPPMNEGGDKNG